MGAQIESFATVRGHHAAVPQGCAEARRRSDRDLSRTRGPLGNRSGPPDQRRRLPRRQPRRAGAGGIDPGRCRREPPTLARGARHLLVRYLERRRGGYHGAVSAGRFPRRQHRPGTGRGQRRASRGRRDTSLPLRARRRSDAARTGWGGRGLRRLRVRRLPGVRVAVHGQARLGGAAAEGRPQRAHRSTRHRATPSARSSAPSPPRGASSIASGCVPGTSI